MRYLAILFLITFFGNTVYGFRCSDLKNEFTATIEYLSIARMYQGYMFGKSDVKIKSDKELLKRIKEYFLGVCEDYSAAGDFRVADDFFL